MMMMMSYLEFGDGECADACDIRVKSAGQSGYIYVFTKAH